jgi:hypothetical protein
VAALKCVEGMYDAFYLELKKTDLYTNVISTFGSLSKSTKDPDVVLERGDVFEVLKKELVF